MSKLLKIITAFVLPVVTVIGISGCAQDNADTGGVPKVDGAHDIDCIINTTVDLLDGVAAMDDEDGDITPSMQISVVPEAKVSNGYAVFGQAGQYRVTYSIEDSAGNSDSETILVNAVAREIYADFISVNGFRGEVGGSGIFSKNGMYDGTYYLSATNLQIAEDLQLKRTYTLDSGYVYTFKYRYNSDKEGRAYIYADGAPAAEVLIYQGENEFNFTYNASGSGAETETEISVLLGGLGEELNFILLGAEYSRPKEEGDAELLENYSFTGNTEPRFENSEGNAYASEDGKSAVLEVTRPGGADWMSGMFIDTKLTTQAETEYTLSFDVKSNEANEFDVVIQRNKFDEYQYSVINFESGTTELKHYTLTFKPTAETAGALFIYVRSGEATNTITFSNLSITVKQSGVKTQAVTLTDFTEKGSEGFSGELKTFGGSFTYYAERFSVTDWHQEVSSPEIYLSGSGQNYIITFKAKATKPITAVFADRVSNSDKIWQKIDITEEEQIFEFRCYDFNDIGNAWNCFIWRFGDYANQSYTNVTIEISDIQVCLKNALD